MKLTVTHLLDDATPGGVTRVIDGLRTSKALQNQGDHELQMVSSGGNWPTFEADVIVSHLALSWRNLPSLMSLRAKHPNAVLIHVEHSYTQRFTALNVPNRERFYSLLRSAYALFDQVVAVSRAQGAWMATRALVDQTKLRTIRSSVDLDQFARLPAPIHGPRVLGLIGRLHTQKGFDQAIAAFKHLENPDLRLKIFGTGADLEALKAHAGSDTRISFKGFCNDPTDAVAQIDALVMPSRWEAFGLVAQEALIAGRHVLVAPVDGLKDQIEDGAMPMTGVGISALTSDLKRLIDMPAPDAATDRAGLATENQRRFETQWLQMFDELAAPQKAVA